MIRRMNKRFGNERKPRTNFRTVTPPLCPEHQVPCRCERTKIDGEWKIQYRYCPICGHPEQTIIRRDDFEVGSN